MKRNDKPQGTHATVLVPLWHCHNEYRNDNPSPSVSNEHLANTFQGFVDSQLRSAELIPYPRAQHQMFFRTQNWNDLPQLNTQLDIGARAALQSGFASDDIRHLFPFSTEYFNKMTEIPEYFFWQHSRSDPISGAAIGTRRRDRRRIVMSFMEQSCGLKETRTIIHELGHIMGLGHPLAELFADVMTNTESQYTALEYCTKMDKLLMDLAGLVEFWKAAFWSNDAYGRLWDRHFGDWIPYETVQLARAAHSHIVRRTKDAEVHQSFRQATGLKNVRNISHIYIAFENAYDANISQAERDEHAGTAKEALTLMAEWAKMQPRLKGIPAVYDKHLHFACN